MIPKPTLPIGSYEGLVTVFAVMLAVEYANGLYDLWDAFIGLLSIYLGSAYWRLAKEKHDFLYSLLTVSLISLGIVSVIISIIFVVGAFLGLEQPAGIESFWAENVRFIFFLIIAFVLYKKLYQGTTNNKSMPPSANASVD